MLAKPAVLMMLITVACGPSARDTPGDDDDNGGDGGGGSNALDCANNCGNPACSGLDGCPVCGMVDQPQSAPIALPDTNQADGSQPTCTSAAQCPTSAPNCVITADTEDGGPGYCAESYVDTLDFVGFAAGATLTDTSKLISVCATLDHSWLGDLEIDLISPDGKTVALRQFIGRVLNPYFLGHPDFCDTTQPGSGYTYCWTAASSTKFLTSNNAKCAASTGCESWDGTPTNSCGDDPDDKAPYKVVPAGNYLPDASFSALQGAQLNGNWTFRVTDLWAEDQGYLFDWSIQFDPSLISDCSSPIIQ